MTDRGKYENQHCTKSLWLNWINYEKGSALDHKDSKYIRLKAES